MNRVSAVHFIPTNAVPFSQKDERLGENRGLFSSSAAILPACYWIFFCAWRPQMNPNITTNILLCLDTFYVQTRQDIQDDVGPDMPDRTMRNLLKQLVDQG